MAGAGWQATGRHQGCKSLAKVGKRRLLAKIKLN